MIRGSVLPHGRNGVVSAVLIGLGRAIGETIAVVLVIGSVQNEITLHLFNSGDSMASVIVTQFGEAQGLHRSALIGLGVILFLVTVVVGIIARADHRPQRPPPRDRRPMTATLGSLQPSRSRGIRKARSRRSRRWRSSGRSSSRSYRSS